MYQNSAQNPLVSEVLQPSPSPNSLLNQSKKTKNYLIVIVLIGILLIFLFFLAINKKVLKRTSLPSPTPSINFNFPLSDTYKGAYAFRKNADLTYDYFVKGTVEKVVENQNHVYSITLKSISAKSLGQIINFTLPKTPPKEGKIVLGKDFKEMFERGFKTVDLRIRYDQNNQFLEWELLQKVHLK